MSEANIAIVQSLYAAFGRGDINALLEGCLPDVDWVSGGGKGDFPVFGPRKGRAGVQEFFGTVAGTLEFDAFAPHEFYADRDKVFVLGYYSATIKKTARKAASEWIHVFTFHQGKVANFREFTDTAVFAEAYRG